MDYTLYFYLLTQEEIDALTACNVPGVAYFVPMNYGLGYCIQTYVLDLPEWETHRAALDAIQPISERTIESITIDPMLDAERRDI